MAETYHILDYRALPVDLLATLVSGLRDDSRVKMSLSRSKVAMDTLLLAAAVDRLSLLVYANTKDAQHKRNTPKSIVETLTETKTKKDYRTFSSAKEFEAARAKFLKDLEKEVQLCPEQK